MKAMFYVASQLIGATAGTGFVYAVTPSEYRGSMGTQKLHTGVSVAQGIAVEMFITFILMATVFGSTNAKRRPVFLPSFPIGMAVTLGALIGHNHTGGSMNPARTFGPAVIMNMWEDHSVFWIGPFLGAGLAAIVYVYIFDQLDVVAPTKKRRKSDADIEENQNNIELKPLVHEDGEIA